MGLSQHQSIPLRLSYNHLNSSVHTTYMAAVLPVHQGKAENPPRERSFEMYIFGQFNNFCRRYNSAMRSSYKSICVSYNRLHASSCPQMILKAPNWHQNRTFMVFFDSVLMRTVDGYLYFYPVYLSLR